MTPELVALVLGLAFVGVCGFAVYAWRMDRVETRVTEQQVTNLYTTVSSLSDAATKRMDEVASLTARIAKLEHVLQVDGSAAMAKVKSTALPGFMR